MKIRISIILSLLLCVLSSCKTPGDKLKKFAEQSMEAISFFGDKSVPFDQSLVFNEIAKSALDNVECPDNIVDKIFQIGEPFTRWELIEIKDTTMDLYSIEDLTIGESGEGGKYEGVMYRAYIDLYKKEGGEYNNKKLVKINEKMAIILKYAVPIYLCKYKIDEHHEAFAGNKHRIATLGVIKHPGHGYKVVSFMWE